MIQIPIVWICISFMIGIWAGDMISLPYSFLAALVALTLLTAMRKAHGGWYEGGVLLAWLLIGAARANLRIDWEPFFRPMQVAAQACNRALTCRLQQEGLSDGAMGMVSGLVLGNRTWMDSATRSAFRVVGASHLLALSGMHLGILYGLVYACVVRWVRYTSWRLFAFPPLLIVVWGYAWITGLSPSLVRASLMLSVFMGFTLSSHFYNLVSEGSHTYMRLHVLALSALVMLWADPMNLYDIGFQLSYVAVLSLTIVEFPRWRMLSGRWGRCLRWCLDALYVSCVAQIGTLPLSAYYFHTVPLTGMFINLLLLPLTMLIIYGALPVLLVPGVLGASVLSKVVEVTCGLVTWWAALPGITIREVYPSGWSVALCYMFLLLVALRHRRDVTSVSL